MEQTKDFRLTSTPAILLIACATLLLLRAGLFLKEFMSPPQNKAGVAWLNFDVLESTSTETSPEKSGAGNSVARSAAEKSGQADLAAVTAGGKLRLYEFYADWCTPCQRLERDVMTNQEIRQLIETNFQPLRVTDRQREDGRNEQAVTDLQKRYRVFAFPTLVCVGKDGEAVGTLVGNSSSLAVYRFLTRVMNDSQTDPGKRRYLLKTLRSRIRLSS